MSERIKAIANFIYPYKRIADVGCDHGYLIVEAFNKGINFAQAIDNKKGPLQQAINNLKGYADRVEFTLADGIEKLCDDIDLIVIAGMGGTMIIDILNAHKEKLAKVSRLVLQANRNLKDLRKFISNIDYQITSETIIYEDSIYYEIIVCEKGVSFYTEDEHTYGPILLKEKSDQFINKWSEIIKRYEDINTEETLQKALEIKQALHIEVKDEN